MVNETFTENARDHDVTNMNLYEEKIRALKAEGQNINTPQIKKALRKVLRLTADVFSDNES